MSVEEFFILVGVWFREKLTRFMHRLLDFIWNWTTKRRVRAVFIVDFAIVYADWLSGSFEGTTRRLEKGEIKNVKALDLTIKFFERAVAIEKKLRTRAEKELEYLETQKPNKKSGNDNSSPNSEGPTS